LLSQEKHLSVRHCQSAGKLVRHPGLSGIVPLATSLGAFAPSRGSVAPLDLPVAGKETMKETAAVIIVLLAEDMFLPKSAFSLFLNLKTALFVASLYADFSNTMAHDYFTGGCDGKT